MKTSKAAFVAASIAVILVIYEWLAVVFNVVPTITEILETNEWLEFGVFAALFIWLAHHFKWIGDLLKLLGK
jgi:hypothetical protein